MTRADAEAGHLRRGDATVGWVARGRGPTVALVPSLGRRASDFDDLAQRLATAGYRAVAVDPRGLDGLGLQAPLTLHDLAADVAAVVVEVVSEVATDSAVPTVAAPIHLVGHALGNRISRCLVADHPQLVRSLTLLAAGGLVEPSAAASAALRACFDLGVPVADRLAAVETAFFAPGHDPAIWLEGWYPAVALAQGAAVRATDRHDWWSARPAHTLVIQGGQDVIAVPENGRRYVELIRSEGGTAELVELDGAGHALLPERPDELARALVGFLDRIDP